MTQVENKLVNDLFFFAVWRFEVIVIIMYYIAIDDIWYSWSSQTFVSNVGLERVTSDIRLT